MQILLISSLSLLIDKLWFPSLLVTVLVLRQARKEKPFAQEAAQWACARRLSTLLFYILLFHQACFIHIPVALWAWTNCLLQSCFSENMWVIKAFIENWKLTFHSALLGVYIWKERSCLETWGLTGQLQAYYLQTVVAEYPSKLQHLFFLQRLLMYFSPFTTREVLWSTKKTKPKAKPQPWLLDD
jgi:hypothetical protein